jgi:hypothetical protein
VDPVLSDSEDDGLDAVLQAELQHVQEVCSYMAEQRDVCKGEVRELRAERDASSEQLLAGEAAVCVDLRERLLREEALAEVRELELSHLRLYFQRASDTNTRLEETVMAQTSEAQIQLHETAAYLLVRDERIANLEADVELCRSLEGSVNVAQASCSGASVVEMHGEDLLRQFDAIFTEAQLEPVSSLRDNQFRKGKGASSETWVPGRSVKAFFIGSDGSGSEDVLEEKPDSFAVDSADALGAEPLQEDCGTPAFDGQQRGRAVARVLPQ